GNLRHTHVSTSAPFMNPLGVCLAGPPARRPAAHILGFHTNRPRFRGAHNTPITTGDVALWLLHQPLRPLPLVVRKKTRSIHSTKGGIGGEVRGFGDENSKERGAGVRPAARNEHQSLFVPSTAPRSSCEK
ncbi:unnamed protein product, partial [Ectocarpus sp. 12 AP-2014]